MKKDLFLGLDIEATGSDLSRHGLIQIGVFIAPDRRFVSDVRPWDGVEHDPKAATIHGISRERQDAAPTSFAVDRDLSRWLAANWAVHGHPVGFGVAGFDMPFVRKFLPETGRMLSYRTVDLAGVVYTLSEASESTAKELKADAKKYAVEKIGGERWHDAGFDAEAAYWSWRYLVDLLRERFQP